MTQPDFMACLETELALLAIPFDRAELMAYVVRMLPRMEDDPDVGRWARELVQARRGEQPT